MSGAETVSEVKRVLEKYRQLVASMVSDQDKFDAPLVEMWWALAKASGEISALKAAIKLANRSRPNYYPTREEIMRDNPAV